MHSFCKLKPSSSQVVLHFSSFCKTANKTFPLFICSLILCTYKQNFLFICFFLWFYAHTLLNISIEISSIFQLLQFSTYSFFLLFLLLTCFLTSEIKKSTLLTIRNLRIEPEIAYFYALEKMFLIFWKLLLCWLLRAKIKDVLNKEFFSTDFWDPGSWYILSALTTI